MQKSSTTATMPAKGFGMGLQLSAFLNSFYSLRQAAGQSRSRAPSWYLEAFQRCLGEDFAVQKKYPEKVLELPFSSTDLAFTKKSSDKLSDSDYQFLWDATDVVNFFYLQEQALFRDVYRDDLTGLRTITQLETDFLSAQRNAQGSSAGLLLLFCDLDNFKTINDRLGHVAGNQVLKETAAALRDQCRDGDHVYRFGGDEFVILLREVSPKSAPEITERIKKNLQRTLGATSLSVGQAHCPSEARTLTRILSIADGRMYAEKGLPYKFGEMSAGQ